MKCNQLDNSDVNSKPAPEVATVDAVQNAQQGEHEERSIDGIDPATVQMYCENNNGQNYDLIFDIDEMLPENTATLVTGE